MSRPCYIETKKQQQQRQDDDDTGVTSLASGLGRTGEEEEGQSLCGVPKTRERGRDNGVKGVEGVWKERTEYGGDFREDY